MIARLVSSVVVILGVCAVCLGVEPANPTPAQVFDHANAAFDEGAALRNENPSKAHARLGEAIEGYRTLIDDMDISNPKLHYNLGNAYMMRGDLGRAIASYRRALELAPDDENLRANLAYARSRVETSFKADEASRLYSTLLGWQDSFSIRGRLGAFVVLFSLGWIVGLARMLDAGRRVVPRWVMLVLLALSLAPAVSLALTARRESVTHGVVVDQSPGLKGPDKSYEQSFTRPLGAGVEFELLERRPGWVYVRLPDGRSTWIERDAVEFI